MQGIRLHDHIFRQFTASAHGRFRFKFSRFGILHGRPIKTIANGQYWDEPTSFFLIENTTLNSDGLASKIDQLSSFSPSKDLLLVINLSQKGYKAIGNVKDNDLHELMKKR